MQMDAGLFERLLDHVAEFIVEGEVQQLGHHFDHVHFGFGPARDFIGEFCSDEAAAQDDDAFGLTATLAQGAHGAQAFLDAKNARGPDAGHGRHSRHHACGQHQTIVEDALARGQVDSFFFHIQGDRFVDDRFDFGFVQGATAHDILVWIGNRMDHVGNGAGDHAIADVFDQTHRSMGIDTFSGQSGNHTGWTTSDDEDIFFHYLLFQFCPSRRNGGRKNPSVTQTEPG